MPDDPLVAHSLAEVYLYLMATPCPDCGDGPLEGTGAKPIEERSPLQMTITARCRACTQQRVLRFALPEGTGTDGSQAPPVVNPTDRPSQIVDVAQWLALFGTITEAAGRETDRMQARRLGIEAAQCLEEALKFYDDPDSDVPPADAFRSEASRTRLREHPHLFSRQRLVELRAKLPTMNTMRTKAKETPRKKRWWSRRK